MRNNSKDTKYLIGSLLVLANLKMRGLLLSVRKLSNGKSNSDMNNIRHDKRRRKKLPAYRLVFPVSTADACESITVKFNYTKIQ